jgi:hypothetical protein
VGKIAVWYGENESSERDTELSQLDIAIFEKDSRKAIVLVEVEETSDRPKTLLGDIFGLLFGDYVSFNGKHLKVGNYTTLVVAGISKSKDRHEDRKMHIQELANLAKTSLQTPNADIGKVVLKVYKDENEISEGLPEFLKKLVGGDEI